MKSVNKMKEKKRKIIKKPKIKNKKEKVLIVAQEIKFARLLSGNEKKTRDRVLKSFKKWLLSCFERGHEFKEDDFTRVWKGLFYAVWMSDKPLVQEDLCETIAGILDLFPADQIKYAMLMFKAGLKVLATEWYGIDHHRMDKFLMLVRRYLRGSLRCVARCAWSLDACKLYAETLSGADGILALKTPLYARNAGSMLLHVVDCFLEELAKVSEGNIPPTSVTELLHPFMAYMAGGDRAALCVATRRMLTQLLRQTSAGLQYRERTMAWRQMGCPRGGPDALELVSDDEEEAEDPQQDDEDDDGSQLALDPRAGRVDVVLHSIPVSGAQVAQALRELLAKTGSKAYKRTKICMERFEQLAKDEYPLREEDFRSDEGEAPRAKPGAAARALRALEKSLVAASDELALRGLSRKHRKRLLAKSRAGLSIVEDAPQADITSTNGDWAVETAETSTDKAANKENENKDKNNKKRKQNDVRTDKISKKVKNNTQANNQKEKNKGNALVNGIDKAVNGIDSKQEKKENKLERVTNKVSKKQNKAEKTNENNLNKAKNDTFTEKVNKTQKNAPKTTELTKPLKSPEKHKKVQEIMNKKTPPKNILRGKIEKRQEKISMSKKAFETPKKVKFVLKNNSMQGTIDYYKSVRQSPSIPYDSSKKPSKTNLKVSTPSPINPFFKKKLRLK